MTGGSYQVVLSDLQAMAGTFKTEAGTFQGILPQEPSGLPDGGSAAFNQSLSATVGLACLAHLQIGGDISDNGTKLQTAHDQDQQNEVSLTQLAQQVTPGSLD